MRARVSVIGNSYAATCQLPALRWAGGADVVAICGQDLDKARRTAAQFNIPLATTSLSEALSVAPDLVLVSTPVDLHADMVRTVLTTTSAAVVCEKPFTLNVQDARELAIMARGRLALVDHELRFSAPRQRFKQLVDLGTAGTPWIARAELCFGSMERFTRPWSWWSDKDRGGGAMQAIASHLVDGLLWMFGPIVDVRARLTTCVPTRVDADGVRRTVTADDHCEMWLTHASGLRSSVLCTTTQVHGRRMLLEVVGSRGALRLVDEEQLTFGAHDGPLESIDVRLPTVAEVDACNDSAFARSEPLFLREVLRAVTAGAKTVPHAATFDDAIACVEVLSAARDR